MQTLQRPIIQPINRHRPAPATTTARSGRLVLAAWPKAETAASEDIETPPPCFNVGVLKRNFRFFGVI